MDDFSSGRDPGSATRPGPRGPVGPVWDRPAAVLLHVVMLLTVGVLFVFSRLNVRAPACAEEPTCNQPLMSAGVWMLDWLPILILLASIVVTILRWRRRRPVFWVALVAVVLMTAVVILSSLVMGWAW